MGAIEPLVVDNGDRRDGRGRKITTAERRAEAVREWRASGMTMASFARREGLGYSTFAGWVVRAGRRRGGARPAKVRFAEVRVGTPVPSAVSLEVRLSDGTLLRGTNAAELAALVRALRA
jgi:transposase-like protein